MSCRAPAISVIVVCWNSADVLDRCLRHLLDQDYPDFEIVVVDDGSHDKTRRVAERSLGTGRVSVVHSPMNRGCPHARNLGIRHAAGEIIAFIDADGYAHREWLTGLARAFAGDPRVGGVASTVFLDRNPLVLNGAGGTTNRQGWAADVCMNVPLPQAQIPAEALYAMGCGMALRRRAVEAVGPFDDRMLNYYDDVDYGIRLWRAGYRVVVAPDAWIDHGFGHSSSGDSTQKQLLCEQHRMRVMLTHAPLRALPRWAMHEALSAREVLWPRRAIKSSAARWNLRHLPSTLHNRWRLRGRPSVPQRLMDGSWGEGFPAGVPPLATPRPDRATSAIDMADPEVASRLPYGWFAPDEIGGRRVRWAAGKAAALFTLGQTARRLLLDYSNVPVDRGPVRLEIMRLDGVELPVTVWSTELPWQYMERATESHPIELVPGDYEAIFTASATWSEPPAEKRELGLAVAEIAFEPELDVEPEGLDMASPRVANQLISGWFEAEDDGERAYRWAGARASALVELPRGASAVAIRCAMPPAPTGGTRIVLRPLWSERPAWSKHLPWESAGWRECTLPVSAPPGDYVLSFETPRPWSNSDGEQPGLWPEARSIGCAVAHVSFQGPGGKR